MPSRRGPTTIWFAILLSAAACTPYSPGSVLTPTAAPVLVRSDRPAPPDALGRFSVTSTQDEGPNLGTMYRYEDGVRRVDLFVYPIAYADVSCSAECQANAVEQSARGFVDLFPLLIENDSYSRMDLEELTAVPLDSAEAEQAWYVQASVERDGQNGTTYFLLFARQGFFFKIRESDYQASTDRERVLAFAAEVATTVMRPWICTLGSAVVEPLFLQPLCNLGALGKLGKTRVESVAQLTATMELMNAITKILEKDPSPIPQEAVHGRPPLVRHPMPLVGPLDAGSRADRLRDRHRDP